MLAKTLVGFSLVLGWTLGAVVLFHLFILGGLPQENRGGHIAEVAVITLLVPIETFGRAILDVIERKRSRKK